MRLPRLVPPSAMPLLPFATAAVLALSVMHCASAEADAPPPCTAGVIATPCAPAAAVPHLDVVADDASSLPTFQKTGRTYVLGQAGDRYRIHLVNPTGSDVEAVVSVDGLDAVDGKPASLAKRGYIVPAYGDVTVDGWRTSLDEVAAFRFGSVHDSYAARTGHARNVGVIGVAFFREHMVEVPRQAPPMAPATAPVEDEAAAAPSPPSAASPAKKSAAAEPSAEGRARDGAGGAPAARSARPGLGTEFGEAHESHVSETTFVRDGARPMAMQEVRYDDRAGLVSRGVIVPPRNPHDDENVLRDTAQAFPESRFAQPPR